MCGAHLLVGDASASSAETEEKALRERPDEIADWVLLIEAYEDDALAEALSGSLREAVLTERGGVSGDQWAVYQLQHCAAKEDVVAAP